MTVNLEGDFEAQLQASVLADAEQRFREELVPAAVERSNEILRDYGQRLDYNVAPVIEAQTEPAFTRESGRITAFWGWFHPAAPHFEFGVSPHTISGNPILSFVWETPPQWVREEFEREGDGWRVFFHEVNWGSDTGGIPESRFVRDALAWLRRELT